MSPMNPEQYIQERVQDQLTFYRKAANRTKQAHIWVQSCIILLGILVPVLANLDDTLMGGSNSKTVVITVVSLLLAALTGISNFRKYGDLWLAYRTTEELLKNELFLFQTGAGPYTEKDSAFSDFVQNIESTISIEHERFRSLIESSRRPTTHKDIAGASAES